MNNIYIFWTGDNAIPEVRLKSIEAMKTNSQSDVVFVHNENLHQYIDSNDIHPAYEYLNLAHKADYLRCYFMHNYGGGYCDIKQINASWIPSFELLDRRNELLCIGYQEVNRWGVANIHHSALLLNKSVFNKAKAKAMYKFYQLNYKSLIGNGAFIFKPKSALTQEWWNKLNTRLDELLPALKLNPAKYPKERGGHKYDGVISNYPVPWSYILGDILHPLSFKYRTVISRTLPPPKFTDYQ